MALEPAEAAEGRATIQRGLVASVAAVLALDGAFYSAVTPLLPSLQTELGLSDGGAGLLVGAYAIGLLVAAIPAGWLTARIGARSAMLVSLLLFGAACAGFALGASALVLGVMRGLQGVAAALSWTAAFAWLVAAAPKGRHGLLIGSAISASVVGSLTGPVLGSVAAHIGRAEVFLGVAAASFALSALVRLLPQPPHGGDVRLGPALRALGAGPGALASGIVLLAGALIGMLAVLAPLRLDDLGAGATAIGAVFVLVGVSEFVLGPVAGQITDRRGARLPLLASLGPTGLLLIVLAVTRSLGATIVVIALLLPAITMMITPAYAVLSGVAEARAVAAAGLFGVSNLAWAGGEGVGALSAGWVAGAGLTDVACVAMAGVVFVTCFCLRSLGQPPIEPRGDGLPSDVA